MDVHIAFFIFSTLSENTNNGRCTDISRPNCKPIQFSSCDVEMALDLISQACNGDPWQTN